MFSFTVTLADYLYNVYRNLKLHLKLHSTTNIAAFQRDIWQIPHYYYYVLFSCKYIVSEIGLSISDCIHLYLFSIVTIQFACSFSCHRLPPFIHKRIKVYIQYTYLCHILYGWNNHHNDQKKNYIIVIKALGGRGVRHHKHAFWARSWKGESEKS